MSRQERRRCSDVSPVRRGITSPDPAVLLRTLRTILRWNWPPGCAAGGGYGRTAWDRANERRLMSREQVEGSAGRGMSPARQCDEEADVGVGRGCAVLAAAGVVAATRGSVVARRVPWPRRPPADRARFPSKSRRPCSKPVPLQVEALGTVTPIASVAIKARLETVITEVHFQDGAEVKPGDLAVHARRATDRGRDQARRGDHRRCGGAAAAGRTRCAALQRACCQECDHRRHAPQRPDPGQYLARQRRSRTARPWKISRFSSITPRSVRRSPAASAPPM